MGSVILLEVDMGYIIDVEILDKRHVGLISTNMEKEAIRRGLEKVTKELKVVKLVTDALTSIKALMGKYLLDKSFINPLNGGVIKVVLIH